MELLRATASEQLFGRLRDAILAGEYAPGEKLPSQRALATEYALNATTVREAIKRLEQLKLVDVRHGDAMRVADWRTASGLDVVAHVLFDDRGAPRETLAALMEARRFLLTAAAGLAAERRTDEQARDLEAIAATAATDQTADFAFFQTLVDAAGNVVFSLILNSVRAVYFEHAAYFARMFAPALAPLYARAAGAVARGDAVEARASVEELAAAHERAITEDARR